MQEMYWTAEELVASQDGLCCVELWSCLTGKWSRPQD